MISEPFKVIVLGGSLIIGGGTIASKVFFSESKEERISIPAPKPTCTIYEMKDLGYRRNRTFKELKSKLGIEEEYFNSRKF